MLKVRTWLVAAAMIISLRSIAAEMQIVTDGKSDYVIVTPPGPTDCEQLAVGELQKYLKQITMAELQISDALGKAPKEIAVFQARTTVHVPDGKSVESASPAPASQDEPWQIKRDGDRIQIIGHGPRAVLFATYQFLDSLGCRFLAPQFDHYAGSAEFIPKQNSISFDGVDRSEKPALAFRKLYVEEGHSHNITNLKQMVEWMPKAGYNVLVVPTNYQGSGRVKWDNWREALTPELRKRGLVIEVGGHGYQNFFNADMEGATLFKEHPEWFGQDAQGKRHSEKTWVQCTSNADAVAYLTNNFTSYAKDHPEIEIYDFWPPDGAKWCECAECAKLGTPSDRQAILVHHVIEAVKPVRPDLRMEVLAYHTSVLPPEHVTLDRNVLLDYCPISQHFDVQINDASDEKNAEYSKAVTAWRSKFDGDISVYSYYRKYAWDSLPILIPHYMQQDLQWYATVPTQGISTYSEPGDWFTYELNHYVLAKLGWNQNADVDAIVKQFCAARYQQSAKPAMDALTALEEVVRTNCSVPFSTLKSAEQIQKGRERMISARDGVSKAAESEADAGVKKNLRRLAMVCDYAVDDLEIQSMRARKASKADLLAKISALHDKLEKRGHEGFVLITDRRLTITRMQSRYGLKGD